MNSTTIADVSNAEAKDGLLKDRYVAKTEKSGKKAKKPKRQFGPH